MGNILKLKEKVEKSIFVKIAKVLLYILVILLLTVTVVQKASNNSLSLGGYRLFMIISKSMEDEYSVGDILVSKTVKEHGKIIFNGNNYSKEWEQEAKVLHHASSWRHLPSHCSLSRLERSSS